MDAVTHSKKHQFYGLQPVLEVADVEATANWYCDVLGFTLDFVDMARGGHARIYIGGGEGKSPQRMRFTGYRRRHGTEPVNAGYTYIHCVRIDELFAAYRDKGVTVRPGYENGPVKQPWGLREFEIEDCNGHILLFAQEGG
jgi:catechol 2,3-dioxygenase-like lactoylglutathione lyase family enzyme